MADWRKRRIAFEMTFIDDETASGTFPVSEQQIAEVYGEEEPEADDMLWSAIMGHMPWDEALNDALGFNLSKKLSELVNLPDHDPLEHWVPVKSYSAHFEDTDA